MSQNIFRTLLLSYFALYHCIAFVPTHSQYHRYGHSKAVEQQYDLPGFTTFKISQSYGRKQQMKPKNNIRGVSISSTELHSILNPVVLSSAFSATAKLLSSIGMGALTTPAGPSQFGRILDSSESIA